MRITLKIKTAWWVSAYFYALSLFCFITRANADAEKVVAFLLRSGGLKTEVE